MVSSCSTWSRSYCLYLCIWIWSTLIWDVHSKESYSYQLFLICLSLEMRRCGLGSSVVTVGIDVSIYPNSGSTRRSRKKLKKTNSSLSSQQNRVVFSPIAVEYSICIFKTTLILKRSLNILFSGLENLLLRFDTPEWLIAFLRKTKYGT